MVALRALVERCGLVLPSRNWPHSGWPLAAHPLGSLASLMRSLKPIGVLGHPNASAIGRGMAITSGVRMKGRGLVGAIGACPLAASALFTTAPHAEAAGVQITGCGASADVVHPC